MTRLHRRWRRTIMTVGLALACGGTAALAAPSLVIDAATGDVLHQEQATATWYPASLTKLMTAYVALKAAHDGRIKLDTPLVVSMRAARSAPSKMGFRPGTLVTLDNALKMLMVKSANDIAVTIAEGVSGSVEAFAAEMNADAAKLGMRESHFDNPNGLPDEEQVTSARDMAVVARALYSEFPDQHDLFGIGALRLGNQIIETHNGLLGRFPGVDGGKTGFTCAAGFNIVASATRGGRHLIVVVLGASTVRERNREAAELLEASFSGAGSRLGQLDDLPSSGVHVAPNMRGDACGRHPHAEAQGEEEEPSKTMMDPAQRQTAGLFAIFSPAAAGPATPQQIAAMLSTPRPHFDPVPVYVGPAPGWTGNIAGAPESMAAYATDKTKLEGAAAAATAAAGPVKLSGATAMIPDGKKNNIKAKKLLVRPIAHGKTARSKYIHKVSAK